MTTTRKRCGLQGKEGALPSHAVTRTVADGMAAATNLSVGRGDPPREDALQCDVVAGCAGMDAASSDGDEDQVEVVDDGETDSEEEGDCAHSVAVAAAVSRVGKVGKGGVTGLYTGDWVDIVTENQGIGQVVVGAVEGGTRIAVLVHTGVFSGQTISVDCSECRRVESVQVAGGKWTGVVQLAVDVWNWDHGPSPLAAQVLVDRPFIPGDFVEITSRRIAGIGLVRQGYGSFFLLVDLVTGPDAAPVQKKCCRTSCKLVQSFEESGGHVTQVVKDAVRAWREDPARSASPSTVVRRKRWRLKRPRYRTVPMGMFFPGDYVVCYKGERKGKHGVVITVNDRCTLMHVKTAEDQDGRAAVCMVQKSCRLQTPAWPVVDPWSVYSLAECERRWVLAWKEYVADGGKRMKELWKPLATQMKRKPGGQVPSDRSSLPRSRTRSQDDRGGKRQCVERHVKDTDDGRSRVLECEVVECRPSVAVDSASSVVDALSIAGRVVGSRVTFASGTGAVFGASAVAAAARPQSLTSVVRGGAATGLSTAMVNGPASLDLGEDATWSEVISGQAARLRLVGST